MSDLPRVFSTTVRRANKHYICYECGEQIRPKDNYIHSKGNWDGKWLEFRTCTDCESLRLELVIDWESAPFGDLMEWKQEDENNRTKKGK